MHKAPEAIANELLAGLIREDGATVAPRHNGDVPTSGYMVGDPSAPSLSHGQSDTTAWRVTDWAGRALRHIDSIGMTRASRTYLGAYGDPHTARIYFDVSEHIDDRAEAIALARSRHEVSVWDVANQIEIRTLPKHYDGAECYAAHESRDCPKGHTYAV